MNLLSLVIKSFRHYFPAHLTVAAGIAVSTAIITGGLLVGDSVRYTLLETARYRTGEVSHMVRAGDRLFTLDLAKRMAGEEELEATPVFRLEGIASADGGARRLNRIQVWGLERGFNKVAGLLPGLDSLQTGECIISENLALRMGLSAGDPFLLRIRKASRVPANAPFVSGGVQTVSARVRVKRIAGRDEMGRLNMQVSQTAPYNVFLSLEWIGRLLDQEEYCNLVFLNVQGNAKFKPEELIQENWRAKDANLDVEYLEDSDEWKISTQRVFIDHATSTHLKSILPDAEPVLTYFANSIEAGDRINPYSFVSSLFAGGLKDHEIIISDWLAEDLGLEKGDSIRMKYFVIGPLRKLSESEIPFIIKNIIPQPDGRADRELAPFIPGLSDAGSCSEWETGVPVDLESIRDKDEDYWNKYRGTPKAFISLEMAEKLWQNRFGDYTSFRIPADRIPSDLIPAAETLSVLEQKLVAGLDPAELGFELVSVKEEAIHAAVNGIDFSQLFLGLSFFILVSGIILTVLLLNFNLSRRSSQTGTLSAIGYSGRDIIRMHILENSMVAVSGTILGVLLSILYIKLVFYGLNRVWFDIVRTNVLEVFIKPETILLGLGISLLTAFLTIFLTLRKLLKKKTVQVQKGDETGKRSLTILLVPAIILTGISLGVGLNQLISRQVLDPGSFFLAGGILLLAVLLFSGYFLGIISGKNPSGISLSGLVNRNIAFARGQSMTIIILLALGTFLVISTGANRKDFSFQSNDI